MGPVKKFLFNPSGAGVTVCALSYGLAMFVRGDKKTQQKMMRLRIGAQLFTVVVAVGGMIYALPPGKRTFDELKKTGERH